VGVQRFQIEMNIKSWQKDLDAGMAQFYTGGENALHE
jgi:hypothetical protein